MLATIRPVLLGLGRHLWFRYRRMASDLFRPSLQYRLANGLGDLCQAQVAANIFESVLANPPDQLLDPAVELLGRGVFPGRLRPWVVRLNRGVLDQEVDRPREVRCVGRVRISKTLDESVDLLSERRAARR